MKVLFVIAAAFGFVLPIGLNIYWSSKNKVSGFSYVVGAIGFILFAMILETTLHNYLLITNSSTAAFIYSSPIIYAIYGGLSAGVFEETARLLGFKLLLNKKNNKANAVAYGIGHGGAECILTLGVTYLLYSVYLLFGTYGDAATDALLEQTIASIEPAVIPLAMVERAAAMMLHIGLSILVYKATTNKKYFYYYFVAIFLHALMDVPAALYQYGIINNLLIIESVTLIFGGAVLYFAIKKYKEMEEE